MLFLLYNSISGSKIQSCVMFYIICIFPDIKEAIRRIVTSSKKLSKCKRHVSQNLLSKAGACSRPVNWAHSSICAPLGSGKSLNKPADT